MVLDVEFTTDEELGFLVDGDKEVEMIGYVDEVVAPTEVGSAVKYQLFKFVLNNGSKRVMVLIWGTQLIQKYQSEIYINRILHIERVACKAVATNFFKDSKNLIKFELIFQNVTVVEYKGIYNILDNKESTSTIQEVTFQNIGCFEGLIRITGFLKTNFALMQSKNKSMSCGTASITDGTYKINVQVANFSSSTLRKGQSVTLVGTVRVNSDYISILCQDMSMITLNTNTKDMAASETIKGVRTPKRMLPDPHYPKEKRQNEE